jgi:uncharacterized protein (DUF433 family)
MRLTNETVKHIIDDRGIVKGKPCFQGIEVLPVAGR